MSSSNHPLYSYDEIKTIIKYNGNKGHYGMWLHNIEVDKNCLIRLTEDGYRITSRPFGECGYKPPTGKIYLDLMFQINLDRVLQLKEIEKLEGFK